jgi:hypothetical protein
MSLLACMTLSLLIYQIKQFQHQEKLDPPFLHLEKVSLCFTKMFAMPKDASVAAWDGKIGSANIICAPD